MQYIYARPNQLDVFEGAVIPWCKNCTNKAVQQGLGVVGAVIMPHNLYLHSGLVLVRDNEIMRMHSVTVQILREG
jgi:natural resistance-associated macrophage protein